MINEDKKWRVVVAQVFIIVAFSICAISLAKLQLFDPYYINKANATTLTQKTIFPARGLFYDRNGKLLVINYPAYDIMVTYRDIPPTFDTLEFCKLLGITQEDFILNLEKDWKSGKYSRSVPFIFLKNVESSVYQKFQENLYKFPGFTGVLRAIREYTEPNGAHYLGYMGEVSREILDQEETSYRSGDYLGVAGLEKQYEEQLRGTKGVNFVIRDKLGRAVGSFENGRLDQNAISGSDLVLSIDLDLQKYGEKLMQNKLGSIVAIEPSTGEILCLVSSPNYDPNMLNFNKYRGRNYAYLLRDTLKPLFDRSSSAVYPPGSIFKPILALAAMQEGVLKEDTYHACSGAYYYKTVSYGCHGHPAPRNLSIALQHSCNSYFIQAFRDLVEINGFSKPNEGLDLLVKYLGYFGLGKPLYSDVATENGGFIPTSDFYSRMYKTDKWRSTYIISVGIGQGELQLSTLQMANLAVILANRGFYYTPHLIKGFLDSQKSIASEFRTERRVPIDKKYFTPVVEGMEMCVRAGTATKAFDKDLSICGKTGTSQNPHGDDHSVFFAFSPKVNPKIAIAVYVENAGWGGEVAAPIASLMIEKYLKDSTSRKDLEERMVKKNLILKNKT
ncbi:MAG: penicillin-binding protein 2 [Saprospiraceae bacterium]|nr:penicillin-binding protein 2 [Saprospiraceae bacterium]MBK9629840.1 penicillin-binding protein 2 [Saprospiraceae bacterium]